MYVSVEHISPSFFFKTKKKLTEKRSWSEKIYILNIIITTNSAKKFSFVNLNKTTFYSEEFNKNI